MFRILARSSDGRQSRDVNVLAWARDRRPHLVLPFWRALRKLAQRFEAVPDLAQHWPFETEPLEILTRALDLRRPF